jgi:hypothetical protein
VFSINISPNICKQHVLLFPRGELGWHPKIVYANSEGSDPNEEEDESESSKRMCISQMEYYAFCLHQQKE